MSQGTLTLTNNSTTVTGSGTAFTADLKPNDFLVAVVGGVTYTLGVQSISNNTSLALTTAYNGPTSGGNAWTALPNAALVGVTAQVAADVARAIRGLNLDKANWQQVFSGPGNITVTLPDGSTYSGPSWSYLASTAATKVSGAVPVEQGGTGAITQDGARNSLGAFSSTGGTVDGNLTVTGKSTINSKQDFLFKGFTDTSRPTGANTNDLVVATPTNPSAGSYACQMVYQWYADGWITGIKRNAGYGTSAFGIYFNGASTGSGKEWNFNVDGTATGGAWVNGSDERHKSKIKEVENALSAVCSWRGCSYDLKDGGSAIGLIAQDVEKSCPVAIKTYGDRNFSDNTVIKDFKYLDTTGVSAAYHTEAIKQLFALLELALEDPDACRSQIVAVKLAMIDITKD